MSYLCIRLILVFALLPILSIPGLPCRAKDDHIPRQATSAMGGITWEISFKSAIARASREHKPILHLQLFGKLNDALC